MSEGQLGSLQSNEHLTLKALNRTLDHISDK